MDYGNITKLKYHKYYQKNSKLKIQKKIPIPKLQIFCIWIWYFVFSCDLKFRIWDFFIPQTSSEDRRESEGCVASPRDPTRWHGRRVGERTSHAGLSRIFSVNAFTRMNYYFLDSVKGFACSNLIPKFSNIHI
jgi:hypothetical protein